VAGADDFDIRTVHGVIDLCRRGVALERQHSFLVFIRDGLTRTIEQLEHEIRKARSKTPPPRRISQTMPHATAPTTRHDTAALAAELEAQRELEARDTPVAPVLRRDTPARELLLGVTHPDKER